MSHSDRRLAAAKGREPNEDPEGTYLDDEKAEHKEPVEDYDELFADDGNDFQELSFD